MSLRDRVQAQQQAALKGGVKAALSTLRLLWAAIRNEEISVGHPLADEEVQSVVARQVKQLTDAQADYERGGRVDLVEKNKAEINLLAAYLPAQLSETELEAVVRRVIGEVGAKGSGDLGRVMGVVMKVAKGQAGGDRVRAIVARLLSG